MTGTRRRALVGLLALALMAPLGSCAGDDETLTVLAAASLTETFTDLAADFEEEHPGVEVRLAFDSSATLAQQATDGAPADVLATADEATMADANPALASAPRLFASNEMVLVTPAGNPAGVRTLADLDRSGTTWVACVETAPCGAVAGALTSGLARAPASLEVDVKAVLTKVVSDEADAGLVYASDAVAAGDRVESFPIAGAGRERTAYPLAPLQQAGDPALAEEFVALVLSDRGQAVLADAGFGAP